MAFAEAFLPRTWWGSSVEECRAHNPEVVRSKRTPASCQPARSLGLVAGPGTEGILDMDLRTPTIKCTRGSFQHPPP
jgi:hypothetical protein